MDFLSPFLLLKQGMISFIGWCCKATPNTKQINYNIVSIMTRNLMSNIVSFKIPSKEEVEEPTFYEKFVERLNVAESSVILQKLENGSYVFGNTEMSTPDLVLYYYHIQNYIQHLIGGNNIAADD